MRFPRAITGRLLLLTALFTLTTASFAQAPAAAAYLWRSLDGTPAPAESRSDVLDAPILPGSVMKAVTLVAALESQTIEPDTDRICRRTVTIDGQRYTCSHPDVKRPLTPAEALAHSCNDFFVSLAQRLPRSAVNDVRLRVGLPPVPSNANFAAALVGLDGPKVSARQLLEAMVRLAGFDSERPARIGEAARRVLIEGLRGGAAYGSASELRSRNVSALVKTGTAPTPGGSALGLAILLTPADRPRRGLIVVAPGAAGRDAVSIAGDLLQSERPATNGPSTAGSKPADPKRPLSPTTLRVGLTRSDGSTRVVTLGVEDYVARVLAGEGQPQAGTAAQEALAIAARTFALANLNRHRGEGFDLCDTTHCQVVRAATSTTQKAAAATAGRVLVHNGEPALIFYSAWCGGRSELASEVWPGAIDYAFEPSQRDEACEEEPGWTSEVTAREVERALRTIGLRGDRLRGLRIVSRNASGRVARLRADGFTPADVTGHDFRMAIGRVAGWQSLKSTAFDLRRTSSGYRFVGRGFGHGVGLCVVGAGHRAAQGANAEQILRFYYPGLKVETYGSREAVASPTAAAAASSGAPAASPAGRPAPTSRAADVLVALPGLEEGERDLIVQLIRHARDDIAAKAGVTAPASIRVTVHPSVESFGRATGQPWWVSGATQATSIDLLPVTILRHQGQLERTIRHEVAHALLDMAFDRRPLWVREGAAFYFAGLRNSDSLAAKVSCPRDQEFLRPVSAGAHRDAYARAEACFRRQIMAGKKWIDVK